MTRPRVPDDKRQRTAQACDVCKRRKQKCNGKRPCANCIKRNLSCAYTTASSTASAGNGGPDSSLRLSTKRRFVHDGPSLSVIHASRSLPGRKTSSSMAPSYVPSTTRRVSSMAAIRGPSDPRKILSQQHSTPSTATELDGQSRGNTTSEPDEETEVLRQTRMLQDPRGRLLYLGDSATLSCLQLIRMIVEQSVGPSPFTTDPNRHMIMEASITVPSDTPVPHILPPKDMAIILVESFFTNTSGLIDVLDRRSFERSFDVCYANSSQTETSHLCILHLTMAIGLVMATPATGSPEEEAIKSLRGEPADRAEIFFRAARSMGDPISGFEDGDLWSVQALSLMAVYTLARSKRNAAYAYYGMAVRTAFALGLHRIQEVTSVFSEEEVVLRRNIWRSLFVLDRFLAASLGRPTAISEEDCSPDSLEPPLSTLESPYSAPHEQVGARGLDSGVKVCQSVGHILKKIYSKRRISVKIAQEIADGCDKWSQVPRPELDARKLLDEQIEPLHGLTILHVHLFSCHATILLSRPFFLYLLIRMPKGEPSSPRWHRRPNSKLEKFAEACVTASVRSIVLVRAAHTGRYLPQRNPFVLYFLFAATLIILSNECAALYHNSQYDSLIASAIDVLSYCAQSDPQARKLLCIVKSFHDVVQQTSHGDASNHSRPLHILMSDRSLTESLGGLTCGLHSFLDHQIVNGMSGPSRRSSLVTRDVNRQPKFKSHSTAPMPNIDTVAGSRPFMPTTPSNSSSTSSRTATNANYHGSDSGSGSGSGSGNIKVESDMSDSAGGEHEINFHFDSLWTLEPNPLFREQIQPTAPQPRFTSTSSQGPGIIVEAHLYDFPDRYSGPMKEQGNHHQHRHQHQHHHQHQRQYQHQHQHHHGQPGNTGILANSGGPSLPSFYTRSNF